MTRDQLNYLPIGSTIELVVGLETLKGKVQLGDWAVNSVLGPVSGTGKYIHWESEPEMNQPLDLIHDEEIFNMRYLG